MINYIDCPICNKPLQNEFSPYKDNTEIWLKICISINHGLWISLRNDIVRSVTISLDVDKKYRATWELCVDIIPRLFIGKKSSAHSSYDMEIPYFEPDFSNYNKLVQKLKTYITFS